MTFTCIGGDCEIFEIIMFKIIISFINIIIIIIVIIICFMVMLSFGGGLTDNAVKREFKAIKIIES